jgi:carbamoyl-phosphate synthase large subunit
MRLLFVNDTDRVEIARLLQSSMRLRRNMQLVATDVTPKSPMRFACDYFEVIPENKGKRLQRSLTKIIKKYNVKGIIGGSNFDLPVLSALSNHYNPAIRILCPADNIIRIALDKRAYPKFCQSSSLATPVTFRVDRGETPVFPCVVKPARGQGSKSTYIVGNPVELQKTLVMVRRPIVQEFIRGDLYTVDIFGDEKGYPICIVPRVRERAIHSNSSVSRIDLNDSIIEISARLGQRLRVRGLYNFQVIRARNGKVYVLDINPRLAPGAVLSIKAGAPFARWTCDLLSKGYIIDKRYHVQDGLEMLRYETQLFVEPSRGNFQGASPLAAWG